MPGRRLAPAAGIRDEQLSFHGTNTWQYQRKEAVALPEGTVKWFDNQKGFGLIEQTDGPDLRVYHTGIIALGFKYFNTGERVTFDIERGREGPIAVNARTIPTDAK